MFKTVWVARFPQGMAKADAREYWANHHGPLCKSTTIEGYVQNHVMGHLPYVSGVAQEDTHFDGYSCGWWSDEDAYNATMASEGWQALVEDGENVFDMTWLDGMSAQIEEYTIIDGPPSPYKVVWMVSFKEGMSAPRVTSTGTRSTARSSRASRSTATSRTTSSSHWFPATRSVSTASQSAGSRTRRSSWKRSRAKRGPKPLPTARTCSTCLNCGVRACRSVSSRKCRASRQPDSDCWGGWRRRHPLQFLDVLQRIGGMRSNGPTVDREPPPASPPYAVIAARSSFTGSATTLFAAR